MSQLFSMRKSMQHRNVRDIPMVHKLHCSNARKPVMAMQYIVVYFFTSLKFVNRLYVGRQVLIQIEFVYTCRGSCIYIDYPDLRCKLNNRWRMLACSTG